MKGQAALEIDGGTGVNVGSLQAGALHASEWSQLRVESDTGLFLRFLTLTGHQSAPQGGFAELAKGVQ